MEVYSITIRRQTIDLVEAGLPVPEVATTLGVSETFVRRLVRRKQETGSIDPLPRTNAGRKPKLTDEHLTTLTKSVEQHPDRTLRQHREAIGVECSLSVIHAAIRKLGLQAIRESALDARLRHAGSADFESDTDLAGSAGRSA
jgi:transposase